MIFKIAPNKSYIYFEYSLIYVDALSSAIVLVFFDCIIETLSLNRFQGNKW